MSRPLVSVAMATFQGERYLAEQLETIYAQTWTPLEVVVSDDASSDGTRAILERYREQRGLRFSVNATRLGLVRNFERALSLCRGDFIALSDQDDLWKPHKVERLMAEIGDYSLIYCNVHEILDLDGQRRTERAWEPYRRFALRHGSGHSTRYLLAENWVVSHGVLFRRELAKAALPIPETQPFHDGWLALVASTQRGIRYLDEPLQTYRRHRQSYTFNEEGRSRPAIVRTARIAGFRASWRMEARSQTARLQEALTRLQLNTEERTFADRLLRYYRAGVRRGHRWRSAWAGLGLARYFHSRPRTAESLRCFLRPLLGGL